MSYSQNTGSFRLYDSHAAIVGADHGQWPWSRLTAAGVECDIIADSSVDGGGARIVGTLDGHRQALVTGDRLQALLGFDHPALAMSREATASAMTEQRSRGRIEACIARDARRLGA